MSNCKNPIITPSFPARRAEERLCITNINIDDIDLSDETFKISSDKSLYDNDPASFDKSLSSLAASINSIGLINLPILQKIGSDDKICNGELEHKPYRVVSGFRRVSAMKLIGMRDIPASIILFSDEASLLPPQELQFAITAISDNAFQRQLNTMEQARGVHLLKKFISVEEIAGSSSAIFNMNMNRALINMLDDIANMPASVHRVVENERLAMGAALKLRQYGYDDDVIDSFVRLFSKIKTSLNKQKEIITNIHEIAARENISVTDVINAKEIREIVDNSADGADENRKGNLLRSILFEQRYPNLSKAKEQFNINLKLLNSQGDLKGGIKLEPPADFEGRDYTISFKFSNVDDLAQNADAISALSKNRLLDQIISSNL
ncbi:MAG: hypothetical protein HQK73_03110 [Desulfamplus sp.]|nr:hypothetical protein [Desulfamplus sp.]